MRSAKITSYSHDSFSTKEALVYILLGLYFFAMFKPVLPFAMDKLAHTFWKTNHIKNVHYHHGSQHVHLEITQSEDDDAKSEKTPIKIVEPVSIHIWTKFSSNIVFTSIKQKADYPYLFSIPTLHSDVIYPPPKS